MGGNNEFFENFERNKYSKKLPNMQRVKQRKEWAGLPWFVFVPLQVHTREKPHAIPTRPPEPSAGMGKIVEDFC